tara:strand:- start:5927 stop:6439 length:513 start_codon:yes stop_codon:yes gene_type:complete
MKPINIEDELKLVDFERIQLTFDSFGNLSVQMPDGVVHCPVVPIRSFPLSDANRYIAIQTDDRSPQEVCLIEDIEQLNEKNRKVLENALDKAYFMPIITGLLSINRRFGVTEWEVETNRGPVTFDLSSRSAITQFEEGRLLIKDIDGNRYEIPNYFKLDKRSVTLIETQV